VAVEQCIEAAGYEFDTGNQKMLIRVCINNPLVFLIIMSWQWNDNLIKCHFIMLYCSILLQSVDQAFAFAHRQQK
jgi:hypothetical protein